MLGSNSFKYDPFGRRIEKISPTTTSIFAYDGDNLIETTNAAGAEVASYTQGPKIDDHLAMFRGTTTSYYEQDGLGSVTSLTNSSGAVAQTYTYDSYGNQTASSGSLTNFFRYTGRELDTETGLYFYRARYYDASSGRFLAEDPIHFAAGSNFYAYVTNQPVEFPDPSGLCPLSCTTDALKKEAIPLITDFIGIIPGEGNVVSAAQIGAATVGFSYAYIHGDIATGGVGAEGEVIQIAYLGLKSQGFRVTKVIPIGGNVVSGYFFLRDVWNLERGIDTCLLSYH
jgi:RHS repeat-associated protein